MTKFTSAIITLVVVALWIAFYAKTGFTIEGALAGIIFVMLFTVLIILSQLALLMIKFFQLATHIYEHFKKP